MITTQRDYLPPDVTDADVDGSECLYDCGEPDCECAARANEDAFDAVMDRAEDSARDSW